MPVAVIMANGRQVRAAAIPYPQVKISDGYPIDTIRARASVSVTVLYSYNYIHTFLKV